MPSWQKEATTRTKIIKFLKRNPGEWHSLREIHRFAGTSSLPNVSRIMLSLLRHSENLERRTDSSTKEVFYRYVD